MKTQEVYDQITAKLVDQIENGLADPNNWRKPWARLTAHKNATTQASYHGINQLILGLTALERGYAAPVWATYAQWTSIGAQVRKGEHGSHCMKWVEKPCVHPAGFNACTKCNGSGRVSFPVGFCVFNGCQVDGYTYSPITITEHARHEAAEAVLNAAKASGLRITESDAFSEAFYRRETDAVSLPSLSCFKSADDYYATALHELAHASGHPSRLNREHAKRFGDDAYAFEELVAELASTFMCAAVGIRDDTLSHGDYLASWLRVLKADAKSLSHAASLAQKACDYWLKLDVHVALAA